eukprot:764163-Hanusia_phi.AAC.3
MYTYVTGLRGRGEDGDVGGGGEATATRDPATGARRRPSGHVPTGTFDVPLYTSACAGGRLSKRVLSKEIRVFMSNQGQTSEEGGDNFKPTEAVVAFGARVLLKEHGLAADRVLGAVGVPAESQILCMRTNDGVSPELDSARGATQDLKSANLMLSSYVV